MDTLIRKKKKEEVQPLSHGLFRGRIEWPSTKSKSSEPHVDVFIPSTDATLPFSIPTDFDENTVSGHQLAVFFNGKIPDEFSLGELKGREAFFVVTIRKTAGGKPKPEITAVLSERMVREALGEVGTEGPTTSIAAAKEGPTETR